MKTLIIGSFTLAIAVTIALTIALCGRSIVVHADIFAPGEAGAVRRYVSCYQTAIVTVCDANAFAAE